MRILDRERLTHWILDHPGVRPRLEEAVKAGRLELPELPRCAQALIAHTLLQLLPPHRSLWIVADNVRAAEQLSWDMDFFYPGAPLYLGPSDVDQTPQSSGVVEQPWYELERLRKESPRLLVTTRQAVETRVPAPHIMESALRSFRLGEHVVLEELSSELVRAGYQSEALVVDRGQWCRRGGILDVYPFHAEFPVRMEWFGNEIESLREFDPAGQTSIRNLDSVSISMVHREANADCESSLAEYFESAPYEMVVGEDGDADFKYAVSTHNFLHQAGYDQILLENKRVLVLGELIAWADSGYHVFLVTQNEGEEKRLREWLNVPDGAAPRISWITATWTKGFLWREAGLAVLTDAEIFGRYQSLRRGRHRDHIDQWRQASRGKGGSDFEEGDAVVHLEHGVGIFRGIVELPGKSNKEGGRAVLEIEYAESARLYVPLEQAYLVSRYIGVGRKMPPLDVLGNVRWDKKKKQAGRAVLDYAARLLAVQAERALESGFAFPPDTAWQLEFEEAFPYEETADQLKAIQETKADMESQRPMDRLICGDVGFGKTEVAIRAAFKAVCAGKQVAILAPTTVLAQQHWKTFRERMADYPVRIEMVSRFVPVAEQRKILSRTASGEVDILIGTHRLLSSDVIFKDPGLVVVDEEQRFGVEHKDALKEKYRRIDLLTLSATPIPRTLYMALMGTRDMSTIETPPRNRIPVETTVQEYDERVIRSAIQREMSRGGQVFFLHNRVKTIEKMAGQIQFLIPEARVLVGHGQMEEHQLEEVMSRFISGDADVLVSTTIIESGIDIPNANTIIIDRADRFGLADLYQLRGRVGRSDSRAYAFLMLPRDLVRGDAGKRVETIRQYSHLGAGFKVAMRDLEIRGAGNLLGTAQSGHIVAVGFELYCRLLKEAISQLKGEATSRVGDVALRLDFLVPGHSPREGVARAEIPASYIEPQTLRIQAYRELAELRTEEEWKQLRERWRDRFGKWPIEVELLLMYNRIRITALAGHITQIDVKGEKLMMTRNGDYVMVEGKFPRLNKQNPKAKLQEIETWIKAFSR
ncbi:MAG: transcription-repair coupling factor [Candidatus Methylacidiphilales bacterium]